MKGSINFLLLNNLGLTKYLRPLTTALVSEIFSTHISVGDTGIWNIYGVVYFALLFLKKTSVMKRNEVNYNGEQNPSLSEEVDEGGASEPLNTIKSNKDDAFGDPRS